MNRKCMSATRKVANNGNLQTLDPLNTDLVAETSNIYRSLLGHVIFNQISYMAENKCFLNSNLSIRGNYLRPHRIFKTLIFRKQNCFEMSFWNEIHHKQTPGLIKSKQEMGDEGLTNFMSSTIRCDCYFRSQKRQNVQRITSAKKKIKINHMR